MWQWVRNERRRRNWTQDELAARAGLSVTVIRAGEQGKRINMMDDTLVKLAEAFGVSLDTMRAQTEGGRTTVDQLRAEGIPEKYLRPLTVLAAHLNDADWEAIIQEARRAASRNLSQPQPPPQRAGGIRQETEPEDASESGDVRVQRTDGRHQGRTVGSC